MDKLTSKAELFKYIKSKTSMNDQEVFWLLSSILKISQAELITRPEILLSNNQIDELNKALYEYKDLNKPLQYIIGSVDFLDLEIEVKPPILIPRPETEEWVNRLILNLTYLKNNTLNILDMCTGTGVIGISLAKYFTKSNVILSDINPKACQLAQKNSLKNNIDLVCIESDLFEQIDKNQKFDLITINPPYISFDEYNQLEANVKNWEDIRALAAEDDGLFLIRKFATEAKNWLNPDGKIFIEIGYNQKNLVENILKILGYKNIYTEKDFAGHYRVVTANI